MSTLSLGSYAELAGTSVDMLCRWRIDDTQISPQCFVTAYSSVGQSIGTKKGELQEIASLRPPMSFQTFDEKSEELLVSAKYATIVYNYR